MNYGTVIKTKAQAFLRNWTCSVSIFRWLL